MENVLGGGYKVGFRQIQEHDKCEWDIVIGFIKRDEFNKIR